MRRLFVDANVFLRFFTSDVEGQHERAARIFEEAVAGKVALVTGPPVLFEVAWTLRSAYSVPREKVLDVVERIAGLPGLSLTDGTLVESALRLARERRQEFADAYIVASARATRADAVVTFNVRDFVKLGFRVHRP